MREAVRPYLRRPGENHRMSDLAPIAEAVTVDPLVSHPADYHVFHKFLERCKTLPAITTAVCWPMSDVALRGAVEAAEEGLIEPTMIGPEEETEGSGREDRRQHQWISDSEC